MARSEEETFTNNVFLVEPPTYNETNESDINALALANISSVLSFNSSSSSSSSTTEELSYFNNETFTPPVPVGTNTTGDGENSAFLVNIFWTLIGLIVFILLLIILLCGWTRKRFRRLEKNYKYLKRLYLELEQEKKTPQQQQEDEENKNNYQTFNNNKLEELENGDANNNKEAKIDLNGSFKLHKNINFKAFLECQGVGNFLRSAADAAITTHHITHQDPTIKIRVSGIISSETTFIIDGPPSQTKVKDRVYKDYVSYAENGNAIQVMKINEKHNYKIRVLRQFTDETREMLEVRSTAYFEDREIEAIQYYRRLAQGEK